jgi:hypothetical protein
MCVLSTCRKLQLKVTAVLLGNPAVSMRSELLVVHDKLGQFPLLTVYVVSVQGEKYIF